MKKKTVVKRGNLIVERAALRQLVVAILAEQKIEDNRKSLIGVTFPNTDKMYTYKVKYEHGLNMGDRVVAPGGGIAKVVSSRAAPVAGLRQDEYKEILYKVVPL